MVSSRSARPCFTVAVLGLLLRAASGRLSLDYAERLGGLIAASEPFRATSATRRRGVWFVRDEARAVSLLIRAQFKHDQKFRLGVLGIVPLTIFYLYLGIRQGAILDPFEAQPDMAQDAIVYLAVLLFPTVIHACLTRSDAYRASWIFHTCPADTARLVLSTKWFVMVSFVLPYLGLMAAIFLYRFRNPVHVIVHVLVLGLLSHLFLQMTVFIDPNLPFSKPMQKGERSVVMFMTALIQTVVAVPMVDAGQSLHLSQCSADGTLHRGRVDGVGGHRTPPGSPRQQPKHDVGVPRVTRRRPAKAGLYSLA